MNDVNVVMSDTRPNMRNVARPHAWVFPPNPVTSGVIVGFNDKMAAKIAEVIQDCCTDENGNSLEGDEELVTFANRLMDNISMKDSRKRGRIRNPDN